jgi:hypothetical protein
MLPLGLRRRGLLAVVLLLAACGRSKPESRSVLAASFTQTCDRANDCVPIFEGDLDDCEHSYCANAAISSSAVNDYHDVVFALNTCAPAVHACPAATITCPHGQCEFYPLPVNDPGTNPNAIVSGSTFSQACEDVTDCEPVYEGALDCCGLLGCPNTAINTGAKPEYESELARRTPVCYRTNAACGDPEQKQCPSWRLECDDGVCKLLLMPLPDAGTRG